MITVVDCSGHNVRFCINPANGLRQRMPFAVMAKHVALSKFSNSGDHFSNRLVCHQTLVAYYFSGGVAK